MIIAEQIYGSISLYGFSSHSELGGLCFFFARSVVDRIDEGEFPSEDFLRYGELFKICDGYENGDIDRTEAIGGIGMEVEKLISSETSFEGDTAHLVISMECWDDGCANSELFDAFCQYLSVFSDEDHYFENRISNDGHTTVGSSVLHMKNKSTGTFVSSRSNKDVLNRLLAMGSPDLIRLWSEHQVQSIQQQYGFPAFGSLCPVCVLRTATHKRAAGENQTRR